MRLAFTHTIYNPRPAFLWNFNLFAGYVMKNITRNVAYKGKNRKGKLVTDFNWLQPLQKH